LDVYVYLGNWHRRIEWGTHEKLIQDVFVKLEECGVEKCLGKGICAIDASIWEDSSPHQSAKDINDIIADPPRCFCYDNFEGEPCGNLSRSDDPVSYASDPSARITSTTMRARCTCE